MASKQFYVEVVSYDSGKVVKRMGPFPESQADKIDSGLNRNLDHTRFYTRVVEK